MQIAFAIVFRHLAPLHRVLRRLLLHNLSLLAKSLQLHTKLRLAVIFAELCTVLLINLHQIRDGIALEIGLVIRLLNFLITQHLLPDPLIIILHLQQQVHRTLQICLILCSSVLDPYLDVRMTLPHISLVIARLAPHDRYFLLGMIWINVH